MNTNPSSNPYPAHQAASINPALLSAFQSQNQLQNQLQNQSQQQHPSSQNNVHAQPGSAKFPYGNAAFGAGVSPAQLMNGIGNIGMGSVSTSGQQHSMNPAQVLQQQQQNQLLQMAMPGMASLPGLTGLNNIGMSGMGINPAALSSNVASSAAANAASGANLAMSGGGLGMGMNLGQGSGPGSTTLATPNANLASLSHSNQLQNSSQQQLQQQTPQLQHAGQPSHHNQLGTNSSMNFNLMSFSREQLAQLSHQLSPQERQVLQAKMVLAAQQQQQQVVQGQLAQQSLAQGQLGHGTGMNSSMSPGTTFPSTDSLNALLTQQRPIPTTLPSSQSHGGQLPHPHSHQQNVGGFYERERSSSSASSHNQNHSQGQSQNQGLQAHHGIQNLTSNPSTGQTHQSQNQHHTTSQSMPGNVQASLMPPPQRPSTAQSQNGPSQVSAASSRPGTAQSQRPPSREFPREFGGGIGGMGAGSMNGFVGNPPNPLQPSAPQLAQQLQMPVQNIYPGQGQHTNTFPQGQGAGGASGAGGQMSIGFPGQQLGQGQPAYPAQGRLSPPVPGSPYRGAKRKAAGMESPRLGGMTMGMGMNMGMAGLAGVTGMGVTGMGMGVGVGGTGSIMGPPVLPRQLSNPPDLGQGQQLNGYPLQQQQQPTQSQQPAMSGGLMSHPTQGMMSMGAGIPNLPGSAGSGMAPASGIMGGHSRQTSIGPQTPVGPFPGLPSHPQQQLPQLSMQLQQQQQAQQQLQLQQQAQVALLGPKGPDVGLGIPKVISGDIRGALRIPSTVPPALPTAVSHSSDTMANGVAPAPAPPPQPAGLTLPSGVTLNPAVTRITTVPLAEAAEAIPPLSPKAVEAVRGWMRADRTYDGIWRRMRERMVEEVREVRGRRPAWWERDPEGFAAMARRGRREGFDVRYPRSHRDRDGREKRRTGRREGLKLPRKLNAEDADRPEQLVPIRLEFDVEHHKMRDTFIWNLNDPVVTPESFAQSIIDDYSLAPVYHALITKSIQDQLSDFKAHSTNYDGDSEDLVVEDTVESGKLSEEDVVWWAKWRKSIRSDTGYVRVKKKTLGKVRKRRKLGRGDVSALSGVPNGTADQDRLVGTEKSEVEEKNIVEEMRILIKLDIIVGSMKLDDQFEWDLDNEDASPEQFAEVYAKELGLGGEFKTAISHCIREQVQMYQKSLFLVGRPTDGSPIQDEDLRSSFLPNLTSGTRAIDQVQSFTPLLNYLSDGELEKNEKERDKDLNKRRKRNMRSRRGLALPDREPIRTYRTPALGFPELDAATQALAAAVNAPTSRRAAAAAASVTIANMVASENGTPNMLPMMPIVTNPMPNLSSSSSSREKKPKGLFKAPKYPPYVLRPRARVTAPTPSTAVDASSFPAPVETDQPPTTVAVVPPLDSKAAKALTAKRAKELEREAKEKEYADGQHANMIDGVWHCSNCGCPENIAIGRRKGPLGDKSQCGPCGKFWHRHRRPLPVEYSSDPEFHLNQKREAELVKTMAKKKGGAAALRAQNAAAAAAAAAAQAESRTESPTPRRGKGDVWVEVPSMSSLPPSAPANEDERAISPMSTTSSASEPPLAQRIKGINGVNHTHTTPNANPAPTQAQAEAFSTAEPSALTLPRSAPTPLPEWLTLAVQEMQESYPDDKFEVFAKLNNPTTSPEYRVKCLDCPGKLYTTGPAESLSNYEVHIKNRFHRQRVNIRLSGGDPGPVTFI